MVSLMIYRWNLAHFFKNRLEGAFQVWPNHLYLQPMELMDFSAYLKAKKIDEQAWQKSAPDQFRELKSVFDQVHPDSFTAQKLFLINPIRRAYPLREEEATKPLAKKAARPMIKPKPKTN